MSTPRPLPADALRSLRLYNLFFPVFFLFLLPGYLARMIRRGNYRAHFLQRLAVYSKADRARLAQFRWTWIQSISVGETLIALKLANELRGRQPDIRILLSTTTTTGFALAEQHAAEWLQPIYNPLDLRSIVRRALHTLQIDRLIVVEGGVWPNLASECYHRGIPLTIASARLSPRSEGRFFRFRQFVGAVFRLFDLIAVPEVSDRARWEKLGVPAGTIEVTGNIKFDESSANTDRNRSEEFRALIRSLGVGPTASIIVAGSTFPGEEAILTRTLLALRPEFSDLFLIIVPRHIERTPAILRELASLNVKVSLRTTLTSTTGSLNKPGCDLLLVDTTGELRNWYRLATMAFVGKSLTAVGGQNPAEPAMLGVPVVFGPHMENFAALSEHLLTRRAAIAVGDEAALCEALRSLLGDPAQRGEMSAAGQTSLTAHEGATERTARLVLG